MMPPRTNFTFKPMLIAFSGLALIGCATFSSDGGIDSISVLTQARTGQLVKQEKSADDTKAMQATIEHLISAPLTANSAVQIALINNRGLQASLAELGVAEADRVQAGRLRNPGFSYSHLRNGQALEIDRSIMFDLVGLLTLPLRSDIENRRFEQAKWQAASAAVSLAANTRRAYFNAIAAQQTAQLRREVKTSAEASGELAQRMVQAGNFSKLEYAHEQVFYADATTQLARAMHNATATREQLIRLMGLGEKRLAFKLPDRLPDLPPQLIEMRDIEAQAMQQRLDVQMAKRDTEATASALGLTKATHFVNVLNAAYINKSQTGTPRTDGYEVSLEIPLFDWNSRSRKAQSQYMAAVNRTTDIALRAQSEVREAYSAYRTTYDIAKHYRDEVIPLRKQISDEMLLRYNGMLSSVFELLADARAQSTSVNEAIESQRDYWLAETDLHMAINGNSSGADPLTYVSTKPLPSDVKAEY